MYKKLFLIGILLLLTFSFAGCRYTWVDGIPDLAFTYYSVEESEITETIGTGEDAEEKVAGYKYDITASIENSGFKGKYVINISALPEGSSTWESYSNYGPVVIDPGIENFSTTINEKFDEGGSRLERFRFKIYTIKKSGERELAEEVESNIVAP